MPTPATPATPATGNAATLAEAIRRHGPAYRAAHDPGGKIRSLLGLLPLCRTPALGGTLFRCADCGRHEPRWRSCGNRHCPQCQTKARERWVANQEAHLLDVPYFHLVFTLPAELQPLLLHNKQAGYDLLFGATAATLKRFGAAHGQLGFTAVLHTWNQRLLPHAHLHLIVPAIAFGPAAGEGGEPTFEPTVERIGKGKFLFPVKGLARMFRAKFLARLKRLHRAGKLRTHPVLPVEADTSHPAAFHEWLEPLYHKNWVVYAKRPFGGPAAVLAYLGRYTHRTAISNPRIKRVDDHRVTFAARDPKRPGQKIDVHLPGPDFLRRFFHHVLPAGFTRVRHYGFLSGGVRKQRLAAIRHALGQAAPVPESLDTRMERLCGGPQNQCPHCDTGRLRPVRPIPGDAARKRAARKQAQNARALAEFTTFVTRSEAARAPP